MERELEEASRKESEVKDEENDGSSPEARDQEEERRKEMEEERRRKEKEEEAEIVTTGFEEMSLRGDGSKKGGEDEEEGAKDKKPVIPSHDFNPSSDEGGSELNEPVIRGKDRSGKEEEKSEQGEKGGTMLSPHYTHHPHSDNLMTRTVTEPSPLSQKDDDRDGIKSQKVGKDSKRAQFDDEKRGEKKSSGQKDTKEEGLEPDSGTSFDQDLDLVDRSNVNANDMERKNLGSEQHGHLEHETTRQLGREVEREEKETTRNEVNGDRVSETEHNFLDEEEKYQNEGHVSSNAVTSHHFEEAEIPVVKASVHYPDDFDEDHSGYDEYPPPPESLKSEPLRPSNKGPAPQPPTSGLYERSQSVGEVNGSFPTDPGPGRFGGPCGYNQHVCPTALLKYQTNAPPSIHFLKWGYNTNLRKPPENWLRMKRRYHSGPKAECTSHGTRSGGKHSSSLHYSSHFWSSYSLSHSSWSMFSSFRYSIPSSWRARKNYFSHIHSRALGGMANFDTSLCMCCVCCNCAKINQTNCCCCYHCVHTISSCRRSDLIRAAQREAQSKAGGGLFTTPTPPPSSITPVSILKKKHSGPKTILSDGVSDGSQVNLIKPDVSDEDEDHFPSSPPPSPIFAFCPKRVSTPSPEPTSYPLLVSSEDNDSIARPNLEGIVSSNLDEIRCSNLEGIVSSNLEEIRCSNLEGIPTSNHSPIKCSNGSQHSLLTMNNNNNSIDSIVDNDDDDVVLIPIMDQKGIRIM